MSLRIAALLTMLAAGLVLATSAGAGSGTVSAPRALDLSTMGKIKTYLRSIGVNPKTVVIQRGKKNYAGPNCPGKGWNCTTGTRVLQVGSQNTMECTDDTCVGLIQIGPRNTFRCILRTDDNPANQRCTVRQTGVWNYARFEQVADQNTGTTQNATQIVEVHQEGTGPSPKNELHVFQRIKQSITAGGTQVQNAHQVVIPSETNTPSVRFDELQNASAAGNNYAQIHQYMDQRESGAATSQQQNTGGLPAAPAPLVVTDCHTGAPTQPNQCVDAEQKTGAGGRNHLQLNQLIDEDAKSSDDAIQTQGQFNGGIDARVHQEVDGVTGSSNSHAKQAMRQNVAGAEGSVQIQIDPTRCCGVSQEGGDEDGSMQNIDGASSQNSDGENSSQNATLIGECDTEEGSCSVHHHGRNDNANETFSESCDTDTDESCSFTQTTECFSFEGEGEGFGDCGPEEDGGGLTGVSLLTESNFLPGTLLTGFEVTMGLVEPDLSPLP